MRLSMHKKTPYFFILPAYVVFLVFMFGPMVFSLVVSFFNWTGIKSPKFTGMENLKGVFTDPVFWLSVRNTLLYSAVSLFIVVPLSLLLALALDSPRLRGRLAVRAIYFAPIVTSTVAISQTFLMLFNTDFGLINRMVGIPIDWLGSRSLALVPVIVVVIWRWLGLTSIYFLAGLQGVDRELYDAARVDGAGMLQRFFSVTLPQLRPMTFFVSMIILIGSMQIFDEPQILTGGGPSNATRSVVQYLYLRGFTQFRFGYASAIGLVLFVAIASFSAVQMRLRKEHDL
ncbi:MAG: sugar ABC transporter permease [Spirochaetia bacterium]|jgi:multiple sugar transport system permease protein|uniref:carbohydrate ABC transporter permease n=1 Tax=Sphaerochaeta sp. TaxID=1972642 RepID=UPI002585B6F2|nr:sugar ABC transporter permease [Sphaerochaeta sp.]MDD3423920.1 sugar ABC transporter permease [Sphaerochaeta sp.]NCC13976.1 sugar ABC transporter permease [Spirochaetia bacterium]